MKFIGYNFMPCMFLVFAGWLAWLGSGYWGWGLVFAFFTTITPKTEIRENEEEEKTPPTEEEINLLKDIRSQFKNEKSDEQ
jgi:hypothetical protein